MTLPDVALQVKLQRWSRYLTALVISIAGFVLIGWQFDTEFLKRPVPELVAMNPVAAFGFICSGISFFLITSKDYTKTKQFVASVFACLVLFIAVIKISSLLFDIDFHIDRVLFYGKLDRDAIGNISNRMAVNTSICFMLSGIALLLMTKKSRKHTTSHVLVIIIFLLAFLAIVGYLYRVQEFFDLLIYIFMALNSALCFLFFSLAILFANSGQGIMKEITSTSTGSITARVLIPVAIILPVILGFLRLYGDWTGEFTTEFGTAILVLAIVIIFLAVIWYNAVLLNRRDFLRMETEKALQESENQIQTIFNSAPDAVIVIDNEGIIVKWNPKSETLFGWKTNEVLGNRLSEIIIPHRYREAHEKGLKRFFETGEGPVLGKTIEIQALNKNNQEFDVALSISPTLIKDKYLFIGFIRDITEKKQAEAQIQKQKQDIQDFIDSMSTLSAKLSTDGKILMVNKIVLQASGLSMEELLNTNFLEGHWWTFDPEVHSRVHDAFKKACSGTAINYDENIFVFGQVLTINFSLIPISKTDGSVDYIVAEGRDITEQKKAEERIKESEEKLSMLFNSMDEGFCIIEMIFDEQKKPVDYRFLVINPSFEKQTGLRDAVGKRMREFAPTHEEHWFETYGRIALTGEAIRFENRAEQLHRWYDVYAFRFGEPKNLQVAILFNDITERKQTEETIRQMNLDLEKRVEEKTKEVIQNEKRFRTLIENSNEVIIICDRHGKRLFVSEGINRMLGYTPEEFMQFNIFDTVPPDELESVRLILQKIIDNPHQPFTINIHIPHKNGSWRSIEAVLAGYFDVPDLNGIVITYRDVTERKKAEQEINEARELTDKLIDSLPGVFYFFDSKGKFIRWNRQLEEVTGYSSEEVAGMHPTNFFGEDEKQYISGRIEGVFLKGINDAEASFITKTGKKIPYYFKAVLVNYEGEPCLLGNGIDITERKKAEEELKSSEQKYKLLFESNPLPMWMLILPDFDIIEVNSSALLEYGYTRDEFLQLDILNLRFGEDIEKLKASINRQFRGIYHAGIWRHQKKDGTLINVDVVTHDIYYEGKPVRLVLANDVTEKYIAQEKLKESYDSIRKLTDHLQNIREEERTHIAREIHDELGQQLTILKMDISWLNKKIDTSNEPVKEKIKELLSVVDATVKTVRRIASELRPSLIDDLGLVPAMEWHLEEFEKRSGIHKHFTAAETNMQLPDEMKIGLFRIFQESLTNVARHSKAKNVNVELKHDKKELILTIADDGEGYNEKNTDKGTLGILGMKERTLMLGGYYNISGSPGKGTTVSVAVPIHNHD